MSKKAGMFVLALCLIVSNIVLGLVLADVGQAQDIAGQAALDRSMQLFQLQIAELLNVRSPTSAAPHRELYKVTPNLVGNWQGNAPKAATVGDCSADTVLVIIAKQCGNLMNGSVKVDTDTAIQVVGGCSNGRVILYGYVLIGYDVKYVMLVGKYTNRIEVQSFSYYEGTTSLNSLYDSFDLVKQ